MAARWPILPLLFFCSTQHCWAQQPITNYREKEMEILDQILDPTKYDPRIRPAGINETDGPVITRVNLYIRSIDISDTKMEYSVQLTFREQWMDERLKYNDFGGRLKYLSSTEGDRIWLPDLYFTNEKEGHFHDINMPNLYIRIFPNGSVIYSIRISLTLTCSMNLKLYPLDKQICTMRMVSYGSNKGDVIILWRDYDAVGVAKNLHLPRFTLEKFTPEYCDSKSNIDYSCIKVDFYLKRIFSYYMVQIYVPCSLLVIASWVSFWLDQSAAVARLSLGVTALLTSAILTSGVNATLPPVSYTKALDVWTSVCLMFVLCSILEFALVNHLSNSLQKRRRKVDPGAQLESDPVEDGGTAFVTEPLVRTNGESVASDKTRQDEPAKKLNCCQTWLSKFPTQSEQIDAISRITFPLLFVLFNIIYWSICLFIENTDGN